MSKRKEYLFLSGSSLWIGNGDVFCLRKEETNSLVNSENWQSKALFGYWCRTIFYALNGNRGLMMTLEGSVKEYLSHIQNRKPAASQIFMSTQFLKRKMTKNILSNWHSNNNYILKNNKSDSTKKNADSGACSHTGHYYSWFSLADISQAKNGEIQIVVYFTRLRCSHNPCLST